MTSQADFFEHLAVNTPLQLSRRGFLGAAGALILGAVLPGRAARAQGAIAPGTRVPAFLEIRPDGSVRLQSPFNEGGQGIFTAMAQIVGEELDVDPAQFDVVNAPPGPDYLVMAMGSGARITGGSLSVRTSYDTMRKLGALARQMLLTAAAARLDLPVSALSTEPGEVVAKDGRRIPYGDLAEDAALLELPTDAPLKDPADFRWIGRGVPRVDVLAKSTGQAEYTIDIELPGMMFAAVQHAPRLGMRIGDVHNEAQVSEMRGIHSIHHLPGALGVVSDSWWRAKRAAEALQVDWLEADPGTQHALPEAFSTEAFREELFATPGPGVEAEAVGDAAAALAEAESVIEAQYTAPYLLHGQIEPSATVARWNEDDTLDIWAPNQVPDAFLGAMANIAEIDPTQIRLNSPMLGGFFGRHFLYGAGNPFAQAILMAKAIRGPVKLIWSREEESLRDHMRPLGAVRFRGALADDGTPSVYVAEALGEGSRGHLNGLAPDAFDPTAVEGLAEKPYAIPNKHVSHVHVPHPTRLGHFRSVGHSMNDFFSESFFDEMADAGGQDPFELRMRLLEGNERLTNLLRTVGELSGGWRRGPFAGPDGTMRARGVAMASPFGSEVATIAEASIQNGRAVVHDVWVAFDCGSTVNPAIIKAQVNGAVALGASTALFEEQEYEHGQPKARNYDQYPILRMAQMPRVHVQIIESGAPMGGVGEPALPGVPPAIVNAVSTLLGRRIRRIPLRRTDLTA